MRTIYTLAELKKAYDEGMDWGMQYVRDGSMDAMDWDDFVESLNPKEEDEERIPFTFGFLNRKLKWGDFCELTGIDPYHTVVSRLKNNAIFYIDASKASEHDLI